MKIGNPNDKPVTAPAPVTPTRLANGPQAGKPETAAVQQKAAAEESTQVALSNAATQLMSGDGAVSGEFDTAKVERISRAIAEGKFKVNADAIADKLLANAREVLGGPQH